MKQTFESVRTYPKSRPKSQGLGEIGISIQMPEVMSRALEIMLDIHNPEKLYSWLHGMQEEYKQLCAFNMAVSNALCGCCIIFLNRRILTSEFLFSCAQCKNIVNSCIAHEGNSAWYKNMLASRVSVAMLI
jgi:hypothetical protein